VQEVVAALKRRVAFTAREPVAKRGPTRCDPSPPVARQQRLF
jgi:hypothetical protein